MGDYKLINLDQMEATVLRRVLDPWEISKGERVRRFLEKLLEGRDLKVQEPKWELNVYPLYYYFLCDGTRVRPASKIYRMVFNEFCGVFSQAKDRISRDQAMSVADAEIDLLIEDADYFVLVEVKDPLPDRKPRFQNTKGIHQLVRQYVQGVFLSKKINKTFLAATVGAKKALPLSLNEIDKSLLAMVGNHTGELVISHFDWEVLGEKPNPCEPQAPPLRS